MAKLIITDEQYMGIVQSLTGEVARYERIVLERAEAGKSTTTHGQSLKFYKALLLTVREQEGEK